MTLLARLAATLFVLAPLAAAAEPIKLKLSYFGGLDTATYIYGVKPFVDAVDASGLVKIEVFANGELSKAQAQQPQLVLDGAADIAFIVPGLTPYRFPDNVLLEQPGQFRDMREGTLAYTRLVAGGALRGYKDYVVIGAYITAANYIHSRKTIRSLADLNGLKIRGNNPIEAEALERLGAVPTVLESTRLAETLKAGAIDAATMSPTGLFQFGIANVTSHHYLLEVGSAPLAVVMNRRKFETLPEPVQEVIRRYSGEWAAKAWIDGFGAAEIALLEKLKADSNRHVVEPSTADQQTATHLFRRMIDAWAAKGERNRLLQGAITKELATIRATR